MPSATRPTRLEPVTPQNAVLLLVDQQEGLVSRIHEPEQTRRNLLALARSAQLLGIPGVMTTALAAGPNGPQLKELTETFADQEIIDRTLINAWQDSRVHQSISCTGRAKVIVAGTGLDVCAQLPALASAAEGYDAYVVVDASGRFEPVPSVATVSRLTQAGVALVNTRVIVLETMADNAHPKAKEIYATLPAGLVIMDDAPGNSRLCAQSALWPSTAGLNCAAIVTARPCESSSVGRCGLHMESRKRRPRSHGHPCVTRGPSTLMTGSRTSERLPSRSPRHLPASPEVPARARGVP